MSESKIDSMKCEGCGVLPGQFHLDGCPVLAEALEKSFEREQERYPAIHTGRGRQEITIRVAMSREDAVDLEKMLSAIAWHADSSYTAEEVACARQLGLIIRSTAGLDDAVKFPTPEEGEE